MTCYDLKKTQFLRLFNCTLRHKKPSKHLVYRCSKVDEIGDGSSDEENYLLPESEDTRRNSDFSKVYKALEQRVKELEEEKVENPTTEREKSKNERIDKKIRCERALAALLR